MKLTTPTITIKVSIWLIDNLEQANPEAMKTVIRQNKRRVFQSTSTKSIICSPEFLTKFILPFLAIFLFSFVAHTQTAFEGTVSYNVQIVGNDADQTSELIPQFYEYYFSGEHILMKMSGESENLNQDFVTTKDFIINWDFLFACQQGDVTFYGETPKHLINHAEKTVYQLPAHLVGDPGLSQINELEKMDDQTKIHGYVCDKYRVVNTGTIESEVEQYVWLAEDLKMPNPNMHVQLGGTGLVDCQNGLPLKVLTKANGQMFIMTAYWIDARTVSKAEFELPSDYDLKDLNVIQM